jgi:predicted amidophosphoribosyltransferase
MDLSLFRNCAICSSWSGDINVFCSSCWRDYFVESDPFRRNLYHDFPHPIFSLFVWKQDASAVGHLIRSLKGDWGERTWKVLALQFAKKYCASEKPIGPNTVFVPAPPQHVDQQDHAYLWARALSEVFQAPLSTVLTRSSLGPQKRMGLTERWHSVMGTKPEEAVDLSKSYIFVDDLITTGATALAAWKALGKPASFQVWTLASRPKINAVI